MSRRSISTSSKQEETGSDVQAELPQEKDGSQFGKNEVSDSSIDPENEVRGARLILIHTSICLCTFLIGLDFNLIATAVPVITTEFDSIDDIGWYGAAFYIALCSSQPLAGKTYTLFPKKIVYLLYLGVFEVGSLTCALAPTSNALIAGRVIAGFGASGVFAGGFVILTTIIPLHKRAIWTGTMSSTFAIASIVGPVIGGAFTQHTTWRWCFYINLPIGGFAAILVAFLFRLRTASTENALLLHKLKRLDGIGFTLFAGSVAMLLLALQWGGTTDAWDSSVIIGLFTGSGVTMALFVPWQAYLRDTALIPPRLFANRNVWLICASSFFVNGPFQTIVYWLPIWFQAVLGVSPMTSGIRYLPTVISDVLASFIGSAIVMKLGVWNPFLLFAEAMVCLGAGLLTTLRPGISEGHWIGYQIFGGIGYSLASNMAHLGMQASLPPDLVPLGATNLLTVISTSCAIFLAIGQSIFQERLTTNLSQSVPAEVVNKVVSVGATSARSVVNAADIPAVVQAYSSSVTQVFYIPAAAPVISFFLVCGCRWFSTKKPDAKESEMKEDV